LLSGGRVSVVGTLLGATFVNIMTSGLLLMRVGEFWILASLGVMLLAAVLADRARQVFLKSRGMI
jgi:ribose transport system permease protein